MLRMKEEKASHTEARRHLTDALRDLAHALEFHDNEYAGDTAAKALDKAVAHIAAAKALCA